MSRPGRRPAGTPSGVPPALAQAQRCLAAGRAREGEAILREAVKRSPNDVRLLAMHGMVLQQLGRARASLTSLRRAAKLDPKNARVHMALGQAQRLAGEGEAALESFRRAAWFEPSDGAVHCAIAETCDHLHRREEAIESVDKALSLDPVNPFARVLRARLHRRAGEFESARRLLEDLAGAGGHGQIVIQAGFELGRVLDQLGDSDGAFAAFSRANEAQAGAPEVGGFDSESFPGRLEAYARLTSEELVAWGAEPAPRDDLRPALLAGFPRSGTTLTEQVLAAHPRIVTTDEAPLITNAVSQIEAQFPDAPTDEALRRASSEMVGAARERYCRGVQESLGPGPRDRLLVDKNPFNMIEAGFIVRALPDARLIVVLRDPRDVCLSCFQQPFVYNSATMHFYTLDGIARIYEAAMKLWLQQREVLPIPVIEIRYEDIVRDTAAVARRLIEFLGVEWDDGVLDFYKPEHRRFITTPSNDAVTEPTHTRAIARWRRYEEHLAPILGRLDPFVEAFGFEA